MLLGNSRDPKAVSGLAIATAIAKIKQPINVSTRMNKAKISPADRGRSVGSRYADDDPNGCWEVG